MHHRFIRGETVTLTFTDDRGTLDGYEITGAVKSRNFYAELTFSEIDLANGAYRFSATSDETKHWPIGRLVFGLKYTSTEGVVTMPEPFDIHIMEEVAK